MSPSKPAASTDATPSFRDWLDAPLGALAGIGPARRGRLEAVLGPTPRRRDALLVVPRAIEDLRPRAGTELRGAAARWTDGRIGFRFRASAEPRPVGRRGLRLDGRVDAQALALVWFAPPPAPLIARIVEPEEVLLSGVVRSDPDGDLRCAHPRLHPPEHAGRRHALYDGLDRRTSAALQAAVAGLLEAWPEAAPLALQKALAVLHGIAGGDREAARRHLARVEWHAYRAEVAAARGGRTATKRIEPAGRLAGALERRLAFTPTASQRAALATLRADLAAGRPMRRLLSGDVGSGKTLVAAFAVADVVEAGSQALIVAPSEDLARQHARTLDAWLRPLGVEIVLLTGSVGARAREPLLRRMAGGEAHVVVGTHALMEADVRFAGLGLVVVDEQQRFGVRQRGLLTAKGRGVHLLALTATPIPRTLALMLEGALDVVRLDPRPGTGGNIETRAIGCDRLDEIMARLSRVLDRGERAFWVCRTVEGESGAQARHAAFAARMGARAGLVTGRHGAACRDAVLRDFRTGLRPLLVATTVIEVGIDVPDASIIVIENAECFGLAQLHQLRGRVGRAGQPASCVLLHDLPLAEAQHARLDLLRRCHDGLALAEADLAQRGAGDLLGLRQSGAAGFRFLDPAADAAILREPPPAFADALDPRWLFADQPTVTGGLAAG